MLFYRYLVLECILATDLKLHFDIIMQFNEKAPDMDLGNESDRMIISQMLIKFADINSPSKPYPLHRRWTDRICEEFYGQVCNLRYLIDLICYNSSKSYNFNCTKKLFL